MTDEPKGLLEVILQVALEDCTKGKAPVIKSMTTYGAWARADSLFMSGADEVRYRGTYKKNSDRAEFDKGLPVRELVYRKE